MNEIKEETDCFHWLLSLLFIWLGGGAAPPLSHAEDGLVGWWKEAQSAAGPMYKQQGLSKEKQEVATKLFSYKVKIIYRLKQRWHTV